MLVTMERYKKLFEKKNIVYHVTLTENIPEIKKNGLLMMKTSNWKTGSGERYGSGEIYAMTHPEDAVRWAAKMDWNMYQGTGSGKISIIKFDGGDGWEVDKNDPMSQATNKGKWLKKVGAVKPEDIIKIVPVTIDMTRALVQDKKIKI